jgi:quinohemoprotein ethanol dehydrogenase
MSAGKIGKVTWADHIDIATGRPVEAQDIRYEAGAVTIWPSPLGAHSWQDMSFSPRTGLVYIPYMQVGARFSKGSPEPGDVSVGGLNIGWVRRDPQDGKGALVAWDPVRQTARWRVPLDTIWNGGTLGRCVTDGIGCRPVRQRPICASRRWRSIPTVSGQWCTTAL